MRFKIKLELKKIKTGIIQRQEKLAIAIPRITFSYSKSIFTAFLRYFFNKKKFEASNNVNPNPNLILHNLSYCTIFIYNIFNELKLYI